MYHTTTEGQMNLLMCAEAPTGLWSVLAGQITIFQAMPNPSRMLRPSLYLRLTHPQPTSPWLLFL
jgi:hypothetical protein